MHAKLQHTTCRQPTAPACTRTGVRAAVPARLAHGPVSAPLPAAAPGRQRLVVAAAATPTKEGAKPKAQPAAPAKHSSAAPAPVREDEAIELAWPAPRPWAEVFLSKVVDTVEDVGVIARRTFNKSVPGIEAIDRLFRAGKGGRLQLKKETQKPVVLVLGTGWGAHSLVKVIDVEQFEVVVVSPRNHFLFTPMLPSTAVGTVEFRSLLEPIRTSNPFATYLEASCEKIDPDKKVAYCTAAVAFEDGRRPQFEIEYDMVVVAVGEQPATFGVPGVAEHCYFMKEVGDTVQLRQRIQQAFELAALPGSSEEERRRVLHFVVVGGGPTGVEFAGTLNDFVRVDLAKKYPELMPLVSVSLYQSAQSILTQFSGSLQQRAIQNFKATGVSVVLGVQVTEVQRDFIKIKSKASDEVQNVPYGLCVWSTGNAARPLVRDLVQALPRQAKYSNPARPASSKLGVDPYLRVVGARDMIALGDCSMMLGNRLPATAQVAGQQGAYVARMVNRGYSMGLGGLDTSPPVKVDPALGEVDTEGLRKLRPVDAAAISQQPKLTEVDLKAVLNNDSTYLQAPAGVSYYRKPFEFLSLGIMAYVGNDKALTQVEAFDTSLNVYGRLAFLLWRSVYITKQVSFRNRVLILFDWLKARVFGRDLSQF
eukprot:GHRQ01001105.1.p1 GENE.GHRQ01001105.1~~GHRQ01001105.1.p1  ORF type:complete len:649 (+),score=345.14 GHRQ01001105.1:241-2187(+)